MAIVANPIAQTIFDKVIITLLVERVLISKIKVIQVKELALQESRIENPHKEGEFEK